MARAVGRDVQRYPVHSMVADSVNRRVTPSTGVRCTMNAPVSDWISTMSASYCTLRRKQASMRVPSGCTATKTERPSAKRRDSSTDSPSSGMRSTSSPASISERSGGTMIEP